MNGLAKKLEFGKKGGLNMLELFCKCGYDGDKCDKIAFALELDETGCLRIPEPEEDMKLGTWEVCKKCKRNRSVGACHGYFVVERID